MEGRKKGRPAVSEEEHARRKVEGLQLRSRRLRARLTQEELAMLLGCSERTISDWEGGKWSIWPATWEILDHEQRKLEEARHG